MKCPWKPSLEKAEIILNNAGVYSLKTPPQKKFGLEGTIEDPSIQMTRHVRKALNILVGEVGFLSLSTTNDFNIDPYLKVPTFIPSLVKQEYNHSLLEEQYREIRTSKIHHDNFSIGTIYSSPNSYSPDGTIIAPATEWERITKTYIECATRTQKNKIANAKKGIYPNNYNLLNKILQLLSEDDDNSYKNKLDLYREKLKKEISESSNGYVQSYEEGKHNMFIFADGENRNPLYFHASAKNLVKQVLGRESATEKIQLIRFVKKR